jgi:ATP adenylyltransferase
MEFKKLYQFLEKDMQMRHIYQPVLIKALVDTGGTATIRQLAQIFVSQDESQLQYYEKRIKEMPVKVLRKRGVITTDGSVVSLNIKNLNFEQKSVIRLLCESRIQEYLQRMGLGIWDYRMLDSSPVSESLQYQILKESGGRCALCGATKNESPLEIDHIKPRSKGGKTVKENLQVLCSRCNRAKSNKDDRDFRANGSDVEPDCPFCKPQVDHRIVEEFDSVFAIKDEYPVSQGHILIIPQRHTPDLFSMTQKERMEADNLLRLLKNRISLNDESVSGFNVGANCGESAGQTIHHAHIHLIPRRVGDTPNRRGGVRGVIPSKMNY